MVHKPFTLPTWNTLDGFCFLLAILSLYKNHDTNGVKNLINHHSVDLYENDIHVQQLIHTYKNWYLDVKKK